MNKKLSRAKLVRSHLLCNHDGGIDILQCGLQMACLSDTWTTCLSAQMYVEVRVTIDSACVAASFGSSVTKIMYRRTIRSIPGFDSL